MVDGEKSSGKSSLVRRLLSESDNSEYETVFLDGQAEFKDLLGCYVVGDHVGEFKFSLNVLLRSYV